jgi:hypothetical protein
MKRMRQSGIHANQHNRNTKTGQLCHHAVCKSCSTKPLGHQREVGATMGFVVDEASSVSPIPRRSRVLGLRLRTAAYKVVPRHSF